ETNESGDISLFAITKLADFYGVTTDYLLGLVENKKHPDAAIADLHLSDEAVDVLKSGN
ncbi:XRE family transcriptional regulator, partial [Faecalibacterium sp. An58]